VKRVRSLLAGWGFVEVLVGRLGPGEELTAIFHPSMRVDIAPMSLLDAGEGGATDGLADDDAEEVLHVHERSRGRGGVHRDPRVVVPSWN